MTHRDQPSIFELLVANENERRFRAKVQQNSARPPSPTISPGTGKQPNPTLKFIFIFLFPPPFSSFLNLNLFCNNLKVASTPFLRFLCDISPPIHLEGYELLSATLDTSQTSCHSSSTRLNRFLTYLEFMIFRFLLISFTHYSILTSHCSLSLRTLTRFLLFSFILFPLFLLQFSSLLFSLLPFHTLLISHLFIPHFFSFFLLFPFSSSLSPLPFPLFSFLLFSLFLLSLLHFFFLSSHFLVYLPPLFLSSSPLPPFVHPVTVPPAEGIMTSINQDFDGYQGEGRSI